MNTKSVLFSALFLAGLSSCQKISPVVDLPTHRVEGQVQCISGSNLQGATVTLSFDKKTLSTQTDASGKFSFDNVESGKKLTLSANLLSPKKFSISTFEIVSLSKLTLEPAKLKGKLGVLACDFNKDEKFDDADITIMRNSIVDANVIENQWIIVSDAYDKGTDTNKSVVINGINKDETNLLFVGTQLADPNGAKCK